MNLIKTFIRFPSRLYNHIVFSVLPTEVGKKCSINGTVSRRGRGKVIIGDNVIINSSRFSNPVSSNGKTTLCALSGAKIIIGNDVGISSSILIARELISVDEGTLIGADVKIFDNDFHSMDYRQRGLMDETIITKPVKIGRNVFIGANSIILKGVTIGENSVIGAGSVVARDVPSNEVWAGNPAKFIKRIKN